MGHGSPPLRLQDPFSCSSFSRQFQSPFPAIPHIRGIALNAAVSDLVATRAVEPAPSTPGFYSRLFVSPMVTGGWRPVIDLSRLNRSVLVSHFHMETAQSVLQSLRPGD